jgi:O-antigen ligase
MQSRSLALPQNLNVSLPRRANAYWKKYRLPVFVMLLHAPLGILLRNSGILAAIQAYLVLLVGLHWALKNQKSLAQVALIPAYLVGSEVMWRMAGAPINWEFGKYAAGLILVAALARRKKLRIPPLPAAYFILLIPGCLLTALNYDPEVGREKLSFNMSGPLLLLVSCWYFSHVKTNWLELRKILFWLIVPLVGVGFTALFYTVSSEQLVFTTESNDRTSGGFGPNQVSALLGLGVFVCLASYLLFKNRPKEKLLFALLAVFFAAQCIMTFSRGGIYNAAGAVIVILFVQMLTTGKGFKQLLIVALLAGVFMTAIFPSMNEFTGGALEARFKSTDTTGRADIVAADFQMFMENPVFGVGVGAAPRYREQYFGKPMAAHTEFSRMIAEHGIFGIISILMLSLAAVYAATRQKNNAATAIAAGCITWSLLFMFNTGMRLAAPSFIFGISFAVVTNLPLMRKKLAMKSINRKFYD